MITTEAIKTWLIAFVVALLYLWATTSQAGVPARWKDTGFSLDADGMTLSSVFNKFSHTYGISLSTSINVNQVVKGKIKADTGAKFLDRLAQSYKFRWFVYNETLYIAPGDDNTSLRLEVGEDAVQDAKAALIGLDLYDARFGWGELPDEGVVIVSGPRVYVNLAKAILLPNEKKFAKKGKQIMLFRLKYASAMDRVIKTRGKSETIPGIKTVLSNLLFGPSSNENLFGSNTDIDVGSRKRSRSLPAAKGDAREVGNNDFSPLFSAPSTDGKNPISNGSSGGGASSPQRTKSNNDDNSRPRIEADPSLNAIMIYDDISKRAMYASLIAELDVQPQQVEIEALIVDIDRSKLSELGVEWGARQGGNNRGNSNSRSANSNTNSAGIDFSLPGATLLISNIGRFYTRLKALETDGDAKIIATPTVLTLDNVEAVLDLNQSAYVSLIGERVADMSDITAGTMLRVIPRIIHDGPDTRVRLEVDIEDGSVDTSPSGSSSSSSSTGSSSIAANVTRSTISTQAIIDAQQTLMIGGYHAESLSKNRTKVPLLGDIPVLGSLFRSETKSNSTRERLFLITPRITGTNGIEASNASPTSDNARSAAKQQMEKQTHAAEPDPVKGAASDAGAAVAMSVKPADAIASADKTAESVSVVPYKPETSSFSLSGGIRPPKRVKTKCAVPASVSSI